jgi:hypothetical protein
MIKNATLRGRSEGKGGVERVCAHAGGGRSSHCLRPSLRPFLPPSLPPYHLILHTPVGLSLVGKVPKGPCHGQRVPPVLVEEDAGGKDEGREGGKEGGREGRREGGREGGREDQELRQAREGGRGAGDPGAFRILSQRPRTGG